MFRSFNKALLILTLAACSCSRGNEPVPVVSLNDSHSQIELKLTDIISDIRIVALEFKLEHPLTNRSDIYIGEKYIICTSPSALLQYDINGRFIRVLATRGNGPEELSRLSYPVVNKNETRVYLRNNYDDGKIECINLESGEFEEAIPVAFSSAVELFTCMDNDLLLIIPSNWAPTNYYYFLQDLEGNFVSGHRMERDGLIQLNFRFIRPKKVGNDYLYYHSKFTGDTIFKINTETIKPFFILDAGELAVDFEKDGYRPLIRECTDSYLFIENLYTEVNGPIKESSYYIIDPGNLDIYKIDSFINDIIGTKYEGEDLMDFYRDKIITGGNNTIAVELSAMDFIMAVSEKHDRIPDKYIGEVKRISSGLSENDNQVLIIGKAKKLNL